MLSNIVVVHGKVNDSYCECKTDFFCHCTNLASFSRKDLTHALMMITNFICLPCTLKFIYSSITFSYCYVTNSAYPLNVPRFFFSLFNTYWFSFSVLSSTHSCLLYSLLITSRLSTNSHSKFWWVGRAEF